ncbi:serine peptidase [Streptomyces sp. NPDC057623]|uniref:serine peptidase n=1 Tax=Streptomyces sp. NPDC057623 TaxID=3346187 RepID=UPI0036B443DC
MNSPGIDPLRVVAVHGVGNSFGTDVTETRLEELRALKASAWTRELALSVGITPSRFDLDFAYYADKLVTGPEAQGIDDDDFSDDPLAQELAAAWAQELGVATEVMQGHATVPLRELSSWIARKFDLAEGPLRVFIQILFREVVAYLRAEDCTERLAARAEVAKRIEQHQPQIVIAHSLGSVVAYEALHAVPDLEPQLFLTLASPLALPRAVFERLIPRPNGVAPALRGARPPGVQRWVNIADPGDPVAIPPRLSSYFDGIALDHTTVVGFLFDFHNAANYLRSSTTGATIAPYLDL